MLLLSSGERERYSRQMMLFGEEGQELLKEATIFIAGAGGLGSPVSMYLAVLGVGTIILADNDTVERTNLNRQILHAERDIGRKKAVSAGETLEGLNPDITVKAIDTTIDAATIRSLTDKADGIVDALDNYPTRYLLNGIAVERGIPLFHGGISGFFGQATTIIPGITPCLRCIFPNPPPREVFPVAGDDCRVHRHGTGHRSMQVSPSQGGSACRPPSSLGRDAVPRRRDTDRERSRLQCLR